VSADTVTVAPSAALICEISLPATVRLRRFSYVAHSASAAPAASSSLSENTVTVQTVSSRNSVFEIGSADFCAAFPTVQADNTAAKITNAAKTVIRETVRLTSCFSINTKSSFIL
jgi:hypothetical protein